MSKLAGGMRTKSSLRLRTAFWWFKIWMVRRGQTLWAKMYFASTVKIWVYQFLRTNCSNRLWWIFGKLSQIQGLMSSMQDPENYLILLTRATCKTIIDMRSREEVWLTMLHSVRSMVRLPIRRSTSGYDFNEIIFCDKVYLSWMRHELLINYRWIYNQVDQLVTTTGATRWWSRSRPETDQTSSIECSISTSPKFPTINTTITKSKRKEDTKSVMISSISSTHPVLTKDSYLYHPTKTAREKIQREWEMHSKPKILWARKSFGKISSEEKKKAFP